MSKIKRWFPVSQDINRDPQLWELCRLHGDRALRVWLEILSIADRNEGIIPGASGGASADLPPDLRRALADASRTSGQTVANVWRTIGEWSWTVPSSPVRVAKYTEYHKTRETKKILQGKQLGSPPSFLPSESSKYKYLRQEASLPSPTSQNPMSETPANGADVSKKWPEDGKWLQTFLQEQQLVPEARDYLMDYPWWDTLSIVVNGLDRPSLEREFGKMRLWLDANPRRRPLNKPRSWKQFFRSWLERAEEQARRKPRT